MKPFVFISYRREDSSWATDILFNRLAETIGSDALFRDVNKIRPGENFPESTKKALSDCSVVLVIIGTEWLVAKKQRSVEEAKKPSDWVRTEIEIAIERKKHIIPVILHPASIPSENDLPNSIASITSLQAITIFSGDDFELGFSKLLDAIIDYLPQYEQNNVRDRLEYIQSRKKKINKSVPWKRIFVTPILLLVISILLSFPFFGDKGTPKVHFADRNATAIEFATQVEKWFAYQFERLEQTAKLPEFRSNNSNGHQKVIMSLATSGDFPGGVYTLNSKGEIIAQATPYYPNMENLKDRSFSHREYFEETQRQMKPVTTNAFLSANRNEYIIVLAAPRLNREGAFIGIINGVVDLSSSQLSELADDAVISRDKSNVNLFLIDSKGIVLASNRKEYIEKPFFNLGVLMRYKSNQLTETDKLNFLVLPVSRTPYYVLAKTV